MKTQPCLPHTICPEMRDKSTDENTGADDFHPKIPSGTPSFTLCHSNHYDGSCSFTGLLEGGEGEEASRGQKATGILHSHMNQLGQVIRAGELVASQVQLHRNMHPGMRLLAHPSLGSAAKPSSNAPPATLCSYRWSGT